MKRGLISNGAEDEASIGFEIVVLEKLSAALEREIGAVDEVFVKAVALLVDVIDLVAVFAINHEQHVGESIWRVRVIGEGE